MPNAATATPLMSSLTGTALSRDYRLAEPWSSAIACIWNRGSWLPELSIREFAAKAAIDKRLQEIQMSEGGTLQGGTPEELQAINDALAELNVVPGELETRGKGTSAA